jgi:hypothetical protein
LSNILYLPFVVREAPPTFDLSDLLVEFGVATLASAGEFYGATIGATLDPSPAVAI